MCVYHYSVCISADSLPMFAAVSFYGSGDMEPFPEEQHDCPAAFTKLLQTGELDWPCCAGFKTAPRQKLSVKHLFSAFIAKLIISGGLDTWTQALQTKRISACSFSS